MNYQLILPFILSYKKLQSRTIKEQSLGKQIVSHQSSVRYKTLTLIEHTINKLPYQELMRTLLALIIYG